VRDSGYYKGNISSFNGRWGMVRRKVPAGCLFGGITEHTTLFSKKDIGNK
jgi:hypothetical protein